MISNPVNVFISGNEQRQFVYEGGDKLYHFCPRDNNLSTTLENNLIFFANSNKHALDVLRRMFCWVVDRCHEYKKDKQNSGDVYANDFIDRNDRRINYYTRMIEALDDGKIKVDSVTKNQFFIVGWADNDTIH